MWNVVQVVIQPDTVYERVQFQFEDDAYDTVPDLITYYVGSGKCISSASGARIQSPKNRLYPLSFYATKYGAQTQISPVGPASSPPPGAGAGAVRYNPYNSYRSPPRSKRDTPPRLPSKKQRSQSLTPAPDATPSGRPAPATPVNGGGNGAVDERSSSADGVIQTATLGRHGHGHGGGGSVGAAHAGGKFSTHSLPRSAGLASSKQQVTRFLLSSVKTLRPCPQPSTLKKTRACLLPETSAS